MNKLLIPDSEILPERFKNRSVAFDCLITAPLWITTHKTKDNVLAVEEVFKKIEASLKPGEELPRKILTVRGT